MSGGTPADHDRDDAARRPSTGGSNARSNDSTSRARRDGHDSNARSNTPGATRGGGPNARSNGADGGRDRRDDERRDARGRQRGAARSRGETSRSSNAPSQRRKGTDPARAVAFDVLRQVDGSDAYANLVLPPLLRERGIRGRDAGFATELAYGTLRLRGRYDAILALCLDRPLDRLDPPVLDVLRLGAHQLLGMRVPQHAAVSETVGLARERTGAGSAQLVNAVLRRVARTTLDDWLTTIADDAPDDLAALAATQSHPVWIARALRDALAGNGRSVAELDALLAADNDAPRVTLVARPGLADPDELADGDDRVMPARWAPTALRLEGGDPAAFGAVRDGRAGVQDEGSQLVALALAAAPLAGTDDARWLDLCAGPGGKAALLAALAAERGARLVANEVQPHRARLVEKALAAVPADAVEAVRTGDGRAVGQDEPGAYDRVLLDAPCTGLGALRRRPESRWRRTPADLATLTGLQRELLDSALDAVRPGGVVGYVTCSPHLAETQVVVADVLRRRDDVELLDAPAAVRDVVRPEARDTIELGDRQDVQLWPHVHGTDAMHLTLLRRMV
ncbi:RsmB/NOP family class I SAM-dependent RNA methyltransferase [Cellulosimicrobium cellulans]|uniref:RsmB/NOP family class I SAM-dependent RNA methyltransferase n=1 Tax=Cellulosimicrobium cellulans TaxID=1710 RepID=UPI002404DF4C|nr:transcription antitermination factor NusB [Cellulosimicrobium cellulans]MDF9877939.1 16S rRNA (cytosine967-C5)-methyltransferase [Cellulosimicrobium cellulans]